MRKLLALALGLLLSVGGSVALAQGGHEGHSAKTEAPEKKMDRGGMGHMKKGMGKSGMERGMDMHAHMQALRDHSKMMEEMTDPKELSEETKKHMRMMDDMMEKMMERHMQAPTANQPMP